MLSELLPCKDEDRLGFYFIPLKTHLKVLEYAEKRKITHEEAFVELAEIAFKTLKPKK